MDHLAIPDASGAFINPAELRQFANLSPASLFALVLLRAAKEIERQRNYIDQLQAIIDAP